jgi:hypothetical protein
MILNIIIVMGGIKGGIEKFSSIAMPALFFILLFVIVYVAFQPGAAADTRSSSRPTSLRLRMISSCFEDGRRPMFFSLSLGMGCMMTYGSYLDKKRESAEKLSHIIPRPIPSWPSWPALRSCPLAPLSASTSAAAPVCSSFPCSRYSPAWAISAT